MALRNIIVSGILKQQQEQEVEAEKKIKEKPKNI
jgi:hypothetical protein